MIVVIIAGGSGTRLWPLSTPNYPKHLLRLTSERSLVQSTVDRVGGLTTFDKIFVVSEKSHIQHVYEQLPEVPRENILVEPDRRGTGNCLIFALQAIKKRGLPADEAISFYWADHVINDYEGFVETMLAASEISASQQKIVDIGIYPTYPSTGMGYIERGERLDTNHEAYTLARFKEKPDAATAEQYVNSGKYYWNTGYIISPLQVLERDIAKYSPALWNNYQSLLAATDLDEAYLGLADANLEKSLSENNTDMLVVPSDFDWADVGCHGDLHTISSQDVEGNVVIGGNINLENARHSLVRNHTATPVAVVGLDNIVVIVTENGILVADKNASQAVGDVAKRIHKQSTQA